MNSQIEIRSERPGDEAAIRHVNDLAFGQDLEGRIVDALRANGAVLLSLVAVAEGEIVGHVLYSPATIASITGAALGPMCVHPDRQRQGIGSALVDAGTRALNDAGCPFIVVLGHPEFYPRFGFTPASAHGVTCEWEVPDAAFMMRILDRARMGGVSGRVRYRQEFTSHS